MRTPSSFAFALVLSTLTASPDLVAAGEPSAAPEFEFQRLDGGERVRLSALRGKVVLIDFWATWCEPCRRSLPRHAELAETFGDRLVVLAVSLDETHEVARRFIARQKIALDFFHDSGKAAEAFGVEAMPYAVILDRQGRIVERIAGEPYPRLAELVKKWAEAKP